MLKNLKELVSLNSYENKDEIIEYLKEKFENNSEEIIVVKNQENENKSILVGLNSKLKDIKPIVLSGHIDTVAPDYMEYKTNPLELTQIDGKAYGLGSIDMKSFVAVILDNIMQLKAIPYPVVIALTTDEETELLCIENVINTFKMLNIKPVFTIVGEPTKSQINNVANGCYEFVVEAFGKACHSSILNQGTNAINIMAKIISFVEKCQDGFNGLTSNCGVISGGDIVNRVPDYCTMKFDIRSTSKKQVYQFLKSIIKKIKNLEYEYKTKIIINKTLEIPPLEIKNENKIKEIANSLSLKVDKFIGGCEAGYYQSLSGDVIIFGVGDMSLAHKPNEFVDINEYKKYSNLLLSLINEIIKKYYSN